MKLRLAAAGVFAFRRPDLGNALRAVALVSDSGGPVCHDGSNVARGQRSSSMPMFRVQLQRGILSNPVDLRQRRARRETMRRERNLKMRRLSRGFECRKTHRGSARTSDADCPIRCACTITAAAKDDSDAVVSPDRARSSSRPTCRRSTHEPVLEHRRRARWRSPTSSVGFRVAEQAHRGLQQGQS